MKLRLLPNAGMMLRTQNGTDRLKRVQRVDSSNQPTTKPNHIKPNGE